MTEPARLPVAPPTLTQLAADPGLFDHLPPALQNALFEEAAVLEAQLRAKVMARYAVERAPAKPDRAVGVEEACRLLAMTEDYLYRHWSKLGGYKDVDGHVKFALSAIRRHIRRYK